ncbi:MAG: hypothetical protein ACRDTA_26560 [Pseudonocardiaceae bacterium]
MVAQDWERWCQGSRSSAARSPVASRKAPMPSHEYERGRSLPSVPVLGALAVALGVRVDDLFTSERVSAGVA